MNQTEIQRRVASKQWLFRCIIEMWITIECIRSKRDNDDDAGKSTR